jgi:N6-adenosine-specific RNA methylase IME4
MNDLTDIRPAFRQLAEAGTVDEVKDIRDRAAALEGYAREAKDSELIDHAVEVRLTAERKAGQLLIEMGERRGGDQTSDRGSLLSNKNMGITDKQSHFWQRLARLDNETFAWRLEEARAAAVKAIEMTAKERQAEKRDRRAAREAELAARITALPDKRYGVILADPEWRFEPYSRETGMDRAADNHFPTSPIENIEARDVESIAADDCALFLCATVPMLPQALEVMASWGFDYRSNFVWIKDQIATGYWNRNRHELLLIGVRGDVPCPAPGEQSDSVIEADAGDHSVKPDAFYELIEAYFPNLPKIELNARRRRPGWDAWGDEAPPL